MSRRFVAAVATAIAALTTTPTVAAAGTPSPLPPTELLGGNGTALPLKDAAIVDRTLVGYRYRAGQQDSDLTVTLQEGWLHLVDTGTRELRGLAAGCEEIDVRRGVSARCPMPPTATELTPMFLEIWPRLGDDAVDGSTLPSSIRMWVLADAGDDVVRTGAGDDFVNGAQDDDSVRGGEGDDWIRTGIGHDVLHGEGGDDKLVGTDGRDKIYGGSGDDLMYGGRGRDLLSGDEGADRLSCGTNGRDTFWAEPGERAVGCELAGS